MASLGKSYLFVQGPPGSGKSTYGSQVICDLLERGKRVAVTSTSHAAIHNLLHKVEDCMAKRCGSFRGLYKHSGKNAGSEFRSKLAAPMIESVGTNEDLYGDDYQLCGGTAWLLARDEFDGKFDYLFIDEAGQVALADALALSLCAQNVVLLGDPSQLSQVSQGRQPLHAGDSVLQHLLGDEQTVPKDRGIFLDFSYRMQPEICAFISDAMYEGRLQPSQGAREHRVTTGVQELAGLYFVPVEHAGNSSRSDEEADEIVRRIAALYQYERDVIVVTPYNAQRRLITGKLAGAGLARSGRHRRQISRPRGRRRLLFDGNVERRGHAAQHGVPLRAQSFQRRDLAGARGQRAGLQSAIARHLVPHARRDGAGQPSLCVRRAREPRALIWRRRRSFRGWSG